jgi:hypothetical protein
MFDSHILGEESLGSWYAGQGMVALSNMINNSPESLEKFTILDEKGTIYSIEEFLSKVEKLKIKKR